MKRVLAAIDFSDMSSSVLREAAELARGHGATLDILHVAAPDPDFVGYGAGPDTVRDQRAEALHKEREQLRELEQTWRENGLEVEARLISGRTVETVLERARERGASWIVVGSHGRSAMYKTLVGSVTEALLRDATVPVLVIPPKAMKSGGEESHGGTANG